ncbi:hypothetical protein [Streptomyces sp. KR80]
MINRPQGVSEGTRARVVDPGGRREHRHARDRST